MELGVFVHSEEQSYLVFSPALFRKDTIFVLWKHMLKDESVTCNDILRTLAKKGFVSVSDDFVSVHGLLLNHIRWINNAANHTMRLHKLLIDSYVHQYCVPYPSFVFFGPSDNGYYNDFHFHHAAESGRPTLASISKLVKASGFGNLQNLQFGMLLILDQGIWLYVTPGVMEFTITL